MPELSRRDFSRGVAIATTALSYSRVLGANDRIRMGFIGVGNRGDEVHDAFLEHGDSQTVAVCDIREDYMDFAVKKSRGNPKKFKDYRRLLEYKEVDAVAICTPDHWHALQFVNACNAGKDVYVEKPLSLTVSEGRQMVKTAERTKRVTQVGTQRRSSKFLKEAAEFVQSGGIGQVTVARAYYVNNEWPHGIGNSLDSPPPTEWEWDQWLGPAPKVPYNRNRAHYNSRWFYDYSGGQVTNMGVHYVDMMRWCLAKDAPLRVTAMGGVYAVRDNREVPDTCEVLWDWGKTLMAFTQCNCNAAPVNTQNSEMELRGPKGTLYLHGNRWEVVPERINDRPRFPRSPIDREGERANIGIRKPMIQPRSAKANMDATFLHVRNFLDCVKSRAKCNCDILTGHQSTSATLIGVIALRTKNCLEWDAKNECFTNHEGANKWLSYKYRAPYRLGA